MKFVQYENGSADIKFSFKERLILLIRGKLSFDALSFRHVGNTLFKMVIDFQRRFPEEIKNVNTHIDQEVKGK